MEERKELRNEMSVPEIFEYVKNDESWEQDAEKRAQMATAFHMYMSFFI